MNIPIVIQSTTTRRFIVLDECWTNVNNDIKTYLSSGDEDNEIEKLIEDIDFIEYYIKSLSYDYSHLEVLSDTVLNTILNNEINKNDFDRMKTILIDNDYIRFIGLSDGYTDRDILKKVIQNETITIFYLKLLLSDKMKK